MPWIDPTLLETVVYLYPSEAEAEDGAGMGGSGFLVGIPVLPRNPGIAPLVAVVTNKHVIHNGNMIVRINTLDGGKDIIALDSERWFTHPDGDDLAVCPIRLSRQNHKANYLPLKFFLTKDVVEQFEIGPGDDCFVVGRFVNHEGKQRNLPSVRFGNIAQMPWEPIIVGGFAQESFLVEARSIAGYSGSPVFVYLPRQIDGSLNPELVSMAQRGTLKIPGVSAKRVHLPFQIGPLLLGVSYCHTMDDAPVQSKETGEPVRDWVVKSNTGMMGVIPAWKLHGLLRGEEMRPVREAARKEAEAAAGEESNVALDIADDA